MSLFTLPLDPVHGPIWNVGVSYPASAWTGDPKDIPARRVAMLIDTGASATSISTAVANELKLPILGQGLVRSVTHEQAVNQYLGDMGLPIPDGTNNPNIITMRDIRFLEFPQGNDTIQGLIGRDILGVSLLQINFKAKTFTIAF